MTYYPRQRICLFWYGYLAEEIPGFAILKKLITFYISAYTGHPRQIWTLFTLTIINRIGTMVFPFLTVYLITILGFPLKQAGILAGSFGIGGLLGSYLGGRLSDQIGFRGVIVASLAINGVILLFMPYFSAFWPLLALIILTGTFGEAYRPAVMSSVGHFTPESQTGRSMSLLRLAISLGMSIAPVLGGMVAVSIGYDWLFWLDGFTCLAAAGYFMWATKGWGKYHKIKHIDSGNNTNDSHPPYKNTDFMLYLLATFILGLGFIQWFHTVPVFVKSEWGFDERIIGMIMGVHSLLICGFELPVVHSVEKSGKIKISVLAGLVLTGLSFFPFMFNGSLVMYALAMLLFTAGDIFYLPFNNAIPVKMSTENRRGEYMSWYWMVWSLTNILGPVLGFTIAGSFGFDSFWLLIMSLVALSFLLNRILAKRIIR